MKKRNKKVLKKPSKHVLEQASLYQYVLDGKTMPVSDMDREQLMRAVMNMIDMVTDVQDAIEEASRKIGTWQEEG